MYVSSSSLELVILSLIMVSHPKNLTMRSTFMAKESQVSSGVSLALWKRQKRTFGYNLYPRICLLHLHLLRCLDGFRDIPWYWERHDDDK